jgi:branched-chain amino acid transport system ATP-binding protein
VAQLGIGLVPEGRQVFPNLSVRENLVATAANFSGSADPWTLDKASSCPAANSKCSPSAVP